jgi:glycerol-3-phosphate dehydrogenase
VQTAKAVTRLEADVLVIGGGATGAGVAWDASLRGYQTILVDRYDLSQGTSGRFHGLLHSGGRYVVKDPQAATECIVENRILRNVAAATIEDTGGLFVTTPADDFSYGDDFLRACADTGVPVSELTTAEALSREPLLNPAIRRAFAVPDAAIDSWKLSRALERGITEHGGRLLTYHEVIAVRRDGDAVTGAVLRDKRTGEEIDVEAGFTINASGAWAGQVSALAGIEDVTIVPGRGIMIAMNHRLVNTVVNRCTMPADGDIIVPIRTVSVIGTTDVHARDPDDLDIAQHEVDQMLDAGEQLVPGLRTARALRVWAGVRPLFRDISRAHVLLDHHERDGVTRFITITGGKLTTFRLMAQEAVDAMCRQLGATKPCRTREETLPGSERGEYYELSARLNTLEQHKNGDPASDALVCECEMIPRHRLEQAMRDRPTANLDDIRRALRLGMGPCQGGFCIYRAAGILHEVGHLDGATANDALVDFLEERWKGTWPILYGDQLRQARLDDWIYQGLLDVEHLPDRTAP